MRLPPIERPRSLLLRMAYQISIRQFGRVLRPFKVIYARKPRLLILAGLIDRMMRHGLSLEPSLRLLIQALADVRTSSVFSGREKAALAFAEETTRDRHVRDETFAVVRVQFTETEIVELAWINAAETYFNLWAHPLGIESDELLVAATASKRA